MKLRSGVFLMLSQKSILNQSRVLDQRQADQPKSVNLKISWINESILYKTKRSHSLPQKFVCFLENNIK